MNLVKLLELKKSTQEKNTYEVIEKFINDLSFSILEQNIDGLPDISYFEDLLIVKYDHDISGEASFSFELISSVNTEFGFGIEGKTTCEYDLNTVDETEVGLGGVGALNGVKYIEIELTKLTFYFLDNEYDITNNMKIRETINKYIL